MASSDFDPRRTAPQRFGRVLDESDGIGALYRELQLSRRAGRIVQKTLEASRIRLPVNFSEGHCRAEEGSLTLFAANAAQAMRLRNLAPRLETALAASGLPIVKVEVKILPAPAPGAAPVPPRPRAVSVAGAEALGRTAETLRNPELRETFRELARAVRPSGPGELARALERDAGDLGRTLEALLMRLDALACRVPALIDPALMPTAQSVLRVPALARVRERMLAREKRKTETLARIESLRTEISEIRLGLEGLRLAARFAAENPQEQALETGFLDLKRRTQAVQKSVGMLEASP